MAHQSNKIVKRRRRADYLKRKKEQAKLGELIPKVKVKKAAPKSEDKTNKDSVAKKAPAKKAPAKKAAKKAPVKKAAKGTEESSES